MEDLIGVLAFIVIALFSMVSRYREAQRSKEEQAAAPPRPPKPRPSQGLPDVTRREIRTARPAGPPRPPQPAAGQRPPVPRPVTVKPPAQQTQRPPAGPITAKRVPPPPPRSPVVKPTPQVVEQETPRMRPDQVRHPQKPAALAQFQATAGREAARKALKQAVEQETDTGFASAASGRERRAAGLPPLFRNMEGIRAGIIFSEIINKPVALR